MNIIGQKENLTNIDSWHSIPNFIIIEGAKGSGKKLLTKYMCNQFNADYVAIGNKVDNIREMLLDASQLSKHRVYIVDGTTMSIGAKNTLLKVTEEAPKNCHIVVTVTSLQQSLPTLISRAQIITLEPYSIEDYFEFLRTNLSNIDESTIEQYCDLGNSFGMYQLLLKNDIELYYDKTTSFLDSIWDVSFANALKVSDWLKLKKKDVEDETKLDCSLFIQCVLNMFHADCMRMYKEYTWDEIQQNAKFISATSKCLRELYKPSTSNEICINNWLSEVTSIG